ISELINFSSKKFVFDIINIIKNNEEAPLIVQKSAYTAKSVSIESVDKLENIDFRKDEYYLDNKVDTFENNAVKTIYSENTIASGTTISSNDYYLVMKVSDNNELGIFNATYSDIIRVIKGKFVVSAGGYSGEINLDKEYLDIKHLKIGVNNEEATLYMAVYGNYPDVIYNRNTGKLDITYDTYLPKQYKILSIPLSTVVKRETGTNNEMIFYMEDKFEWDKDNEDIRSQMSDFIKNTKHEIEADDVSFRGIVTEDQDKVYFGYEKSVVHKGIYSLIFYDFNRNCLQFYSPITHSTELDKDTSEDDIKNFVKDLDPSKFYQVFSNSSYFDYDATKD
ncbi:MAG: hypothetical protein K2N99_00210, partial [Malacoplasma sp.]|nr:hypothetical protein [Malacoplasma sp.]